jgi:hypothetical protein
VDIDAGNALVERIKPAAKRTNRPGTMGGWAAFGALFDLKAAGYTDPILVAATDGVGTKLRIAIDTGNVDTIGIDLVAMCVNDLVCQGAEPLFFLDYFATGKLDVDQATRIINGIAEGCAPSGCALIGGETAEMPGMYHKGDFDLAGFAVGAMERGTRSAAGVAEGDVLLGLASNGVHSNGYSASCARWWSCRALAGTRPAPSAGHAGRGAAGADAALCEAGAGGDAGGRRACAGPYHRRRPDRKPAARAARRAGLRDRPVGLGPCRRCSAGWRKPRACRAGTAEDLQLRHRHDAGGGGRPGRGASRRCCARQGETVVPLGPRRAGAGRDLQGRLL